MHYRVAWLRLVVCAEKLLNWAKDSALPPTSLVAALQAALIDPALTIIYPEISEKITFVLFVSYLNFLIFMGKLWGQICDHMCGYYIFPIYDLI